MPQELPPRKYDSTLHHFDCKRFIAAALQGLLAQATASPDYNTHDRGWGNEVECRNADRVLARRALEIGLATAQSYKEWHDSMC